MLVQTLAVLNTLSAMNKILTARSLLRLKAFDKMSPGYIAILVDSVDDTRDGIKVVGHQNFKRPRMGRVVFSGGLDQYCEGFEWKEGDRVLLPNTGMQDFYVYDEEGKEQLLKIVHMRRVLAGLQGDEEEE